MQRAMVTDGAGVGYFIMACFAIDFLFIIPSMGERGSKHWVFLACGSWAVTCGLWPISHWGMAHSVLPFPIDS